MGQSRVKNITQTFGISSYTFDSSNSIIKITTTNNHDLFTGIPVLLNSDIQYTSNTTVANVQTANTFWANSSVYLNNLTSYTIKGYLSNNSGVQSEITLPRGTGVPLIIESYVQGTGGAAYGIDLSTDGKHWISNTSYIIHTTSDGNTANTEIIPGWPYMRANLGSVGANTNLVISIGS